MPRVVRSSVATPTQRPQGAEFRSPARSDGPMAAAQERRSALLLLGLVSPSGLGRSRSSRWLGSSPSPPRAQSAPCQTGRRRRLHPRPRGPPPRQTAAAPESGASSLRGGATPTSPRGPHRSTAAGGHLLPNRSSRAAAGKARPRSDPAARCCVAPAELPRGRRRDRELRRESARSGSADRDRPPSRGARRRRTPETTRAAARSEASPCLRG
jgi:hypothetical protein